MIKVYKVEPVTFLSFEDFYIATRSLQDDPPCRAAIREELAAEPKNDFEIQAMAAYLDKEWELCPDSTWLKHTCNCGHNRSI